MKRDGRTHQLCARGCKLNRLLYCEVKSRVSELVAKLADHLDVFSREHLTSITSTREERTMAMLRYGFALGHQAAVSVVQGAAPEQAARMTQAGWRTAKETGMTDWD